jgi:chorismate dehydratase
MPAASMSRLRIATVPYVNAAPLVWGFAHAQGFPACDIVTAPPARIPDMLLAGQSDAGLIPVIEAPRLERAGIALLPTPGIASRRRARSVLLVARRPIDTIRSIALDSGSRTSAALLRIVLAHRRVGPVAFAESAPDLPAMLREHDAALVIGDPALAADTRGLVVHDLAEEWHAMTGLPFVFAAWAIHPAAPIADVGRWFEASMREGVRHIDAIAAAAARSLGLTAASVSDYLRENIHHEIGPGERQALALFFARAHDLGLIGRPGPPLYHTALPREAAAPGRITT